MHLVEALHGNSHQQGSRTVGVIVATGWFRSSRSFAGVIRPLSALHRRQPSSSKPARRCRRPLQQAAVVRRLQVALSLRDRKRVAAQHLNDESSSPKIGRSARARASCRGATGLTLRTSGRRVLVDDWTPLHCWSIGTQFMPDPSPPPRMLSAPLRLTAMTLRGLGPYLHGARLEIKPLTILCGETARENRRGLTRFGSCGSLC